jgi:hypothetical protein
MVLIGIIIATVVNVFKTTRPTKSIVVDWGIRFCHLSMSNILSIGLLKQLLQTIHPQGHLLGTIPAFWVVMQKLPEKPITLLALFILSTLLFYLSLILHPDMIANQQYLINNQKINNQRSLQSTIHLDSMSRSELEKNIIQSKHFQIQDTLPKSLYILIMTVYAGTIHGPLYSFTGKYCSPSLLFNQPYAVFICTMAGLYRAYLIISIAWMQQNIIHLVMENNTDIKIIPWIHAILLIFSITWNNNQVVNNILTAFQANQNMLKIKYIVAVFAVAFLFDWSNLNYVLTLICVFQMTSNCLTCIFYYFFSFF